MIVWLILVLRLAAASLRSRRNLLLETLALQHHLLDLSRGSKPPRLTDGNPDPVNGKIVIMPLSASNGYGAWHRGDESDTSTTFMTRAKANPALNTKLFIAYGFE
jgi:hypothetical protein